jgi:REP element-mobilizing transposase RayT
MPRKARIDAPGALHHIMVRGIEKRNVFLDNRDREKFLERLGDILEDTETPCYAWALIPNHFHLLLKTGLVPIATIMRRLLTGYAVFFNLRHKRNGHLFQNRYKSILCQEETYLLELFRYIHLNPLRAGLVKDLQELNRYLYGGHSTVVGKVKRDWQQVDYVLRFFGKKLSAARQNYFRFMEKGVSQGRRPELTGGGLLRSLGGWAALNALKSSSDRVKSDERILGDSDFVNTVLREADESLEHRYKLKVTGYDIDRVAQRVAEVLDIPVDLVWERSRRPVVVQARSLLCHWASMELGMNMTEIAGRLGLGQPAVSIAARRGEKLAEENGYRLADD